jgi:hypothetical protein
MAAAPGAESSGPRQPARTVPWGWSTPTPPWPGGPKSGGRRPAGESIPGLTSASCGLGSPAIHQRHTRGAALTSAVSRCPARSRAFKDVRNVLTRSSGEDQQSVRRTTVLPVAISDGSGLQLPSGRRRIRATNTGDWLVDDLELLRREFAAEEGSFLLQLRCDLHWDRGAFSRLEQAMRRVCAQQEPQEQSLRNTAPGWTRPWVMAIARASVTRLVRM